MSYSYMRGIASFAARVTPKRLEILTTGWANKARELARNRKLPLDITSDYLDRLDALNAVNVKVQDIKPVLTKDRKLSGLMHLNSEAEPNHHYIQNLVKNPRGFVDNKYGNLTKNSSNYIKDRYPANDTVGISGLNIDLNDYYSKTYGIPELSFEDMKEMIKNKTLKKGNIQGKISDLNYYS